MSHFNPTAPTTTTLLRDEYRTPPEIFNPLNRVFRFTVDAASTHENALVKKHWTAEENGLVQSWRGESVFCNPPYTNGAYGDWVRKAGRESEGTAPNTSALVLPFNPETKNFAGVWLWGKYLILPYKRIKFLRPNGSRAGSPTFYSCISIFTSLHRLDNEMLQVLRGIGHVIDLDNGLLHRIPEEL